jgi:hypothetical protein
MITDAMINIKPTTKHADNTIAQSRSVQNPVSNSAGGTKKWMMTTTISNNNPTIAMIFGAPMIYFRPFL